MAKSIDKNLTRSDIAQYVEGKMPHLTTDKTLKMVKFLLDDMMERAQEGREVHLAGFGKLKQVTKTERIGRNPKTGEPHIIPARKRLTFVFSNRLTPNRGES